MKVTVTVGGQFHAFELARQLQKRGCLELLITGYPRCKVDGFDLPPEKVVSLPLGQAFYRGWRRLPAPLRNLADPVYRSSELFDRQASRRLAGGDLLVGWSSFSLRTLREAKRRGMKTILERGSSHILHRQQILREEYDLVGCRGTLAHPSIVEKELREYEEADFIAVPSTYARDSFIRRGVSPGKIIRCSLGVNLNDFQKVSLNDSVFRVIFAGCLCLRKGLQYLLQAFRELKLPGSELLLVGSVLPETKPLLRRYAGTFKYIDSVSGSRLYEYYSRGTVFVMPSIDDGFGMVILQAMACGLPVICTDHTGGLDIVEEGKNGFIVPIRDVEALKAKLLQLYRDPDLRRELGEQAKQKVRRGFSWDDYGKRVIGEYRRILGESSR